MTPGRPARAVVLALRGVSALALAGLAATAWTAPTPAAPILVCADEGHFGTYAAEILKTEGLSELQVMAPGEALAESSDLSRYDVVVLAESTLDATQVARLRRYVEAGGRLIAFRPSQELASVFGAVRAAGTLAEGYLRIGKTRLVGRGFSQDTLQFHGEADRYRLTSATALATLYRDARTPTPFPAVFHARLGRGEAVFFAYNLPQGVVLTRQGNSRWAGAEKDGIAGVRAADMFAQGWTDPAKTPLSQADQQMRLLTRLLESLSPKPLPRLWYFPDRVKSLVLLTADGEESKEADIESQLAEVKARGARMTVYLIGTYVRPETARRWVADGFEISGHVNDTAEAGDPTNAGMSAQVRATVAGLQAAYGLSMRTVRNHWIVWCGKDAHGQPDFAAQAEIEAANGIGFDCNYYHYDQGSPQGHFLGPVGNFTGSGLPMRFAGARGQVLPIFGSVTQLPDEQWGEGRLFSSFKTLLDRSLDQGQYSYLDLNLHTDRWQKWSRPEGLQILDYARRRGVPVWTVEKALDFVLARDAARFEDVRWQDRRLSFVLDRGSPERRVTLMIPRGYQGLALRSLRIDGQDQAIAGESINGREYVLAVPAAPRVAIEAAYGEAPEPKR